MPSRRQLLSSLLQVTTLPILLNACSQSRPLKVGIHPWIGYESLNIAQNFHFLDEQIQLIRGESATDSLQGLKNGTLDAAALTLDEVLLAYGQGTPLTVVLVFDISAGADQVIVKPHIKNIEELKGRRIGYESSALGALMLNKFLAHSGLQRSDIKRIDVPVGPQQIGHWKTNQVDAVITYEPTAAALRELGGKVLFDSRAIPETIFDVLAVRTDRLGSFEPQIKALIDAHFKILLHLQTNTGDATHRIAASQGISAQQVRQALRGIRLPNRAINYRLLAENGRVNVTAQELNDIMSKNGLLNPKPLPPSLTDSQFLPR